MPTRPHWLLLISFLSVAAVALLWTVATNRGWIAPVFFPSPQAVWKEAAAVIANGQLAMDVWMSSKRVFAGFFLATLIAVSSASSWASGRWRTR